MTDAPRLLNIGILGCGPISQAAHFESANKAKNVALHAICDVADDLRERIAAMHAPQKTYRDYDAMLADPDIDAIIVATADAFHVAAARAALAAGKRVLCEKPLGVSVEEVEGLKQAVAQSGKLPQVGHMKRFDAGLALAPVALGGISMGAAIALRLTGTAPDLVGALLRNHPPAEARWLFEDSVTATLLRVAGPDNLASIRGFLRESRLLSPRRCCAASRPMAWT